MKFITKLLGTVITVSVVALGLGQANAQTACTMQYDPVCGIDGKTYGNSCMAQGVKIDYNGECLVDPTLDDDVQNDNNIICTNEYEPVCGKLQVKCITSPCPPLEIVYANACEAKSDGAVITYKGEDVECDRRIEDSKNPVEELIPQESGNLDLVSGVMGMKDLIIWAYNNGITRYDTIDAFMPNQTISREQAAKMLVAAVESDNTLMIPMLDVVCNFNDQALIDYTLLNQVIMSCKYNLFRGYQGDFMPKNLLNNTDTNTLLSRIADYSQGASEYINTNPIPMDYAPTTRGMYITYLHDIMIKHRAPSIDTTPMDMTQNQKDLDAAKLLWIKQGSNSYTISQSKSCFCPPEYTRSMSYKVVNNSIVTGSLMYTDDMTAVTIDTNLHTVDQAFAMIQQAIDDKVASLTVEYDPTTGYPTTISIDRDVMMADEELYFSFNIPKEDMITSSITINLSGSYTLQTYDGSVVSNSGVTLTFDDTKVYATICNNLSANYTANNSLIRLGSIMSTRMACTDNILSMLESNFLAQSDVDYIIDNGNLTTSANGHTWVWVAQ